MDRIAQGQMKHTPGPWFFQSYPLHEAKVDLHGIWSRSLGSPIIVARTCYYPASEANARLIALAPEMAEALRDLLGDEPWTEGQCTEPGQRQCPHCGRQYEATEDEPLPEYCDSDDCPGYRARALLRRLGETT